MLLTKLKSRFLRALLLAVVLGFPLLTAAQVIDPSKGNSAYFMQRDDEVALARWDLLDAESSEIFESYLQWDKNKVGFANFALLYNSGKNKKVKGRIIIDGWGSKTTNAPDFNVVETLSPAVLKVLLKYGIEVRIYNPVTGISNFLNPLTFKKSMERLHSKVFWLKGLNLISEGDRNNLNVNFRLEHTMGKRGVGYRSTETLVQGPVVSDVATYANQIWDVATAPDLSAVTEEEMAVAERNLERYYRRVTEIRSKFPRVDWLAKLTPVTSVRFIHDAIKERGTVFPMDEEVIKQLDLATKDEPVVFVSPYINLPQGLYDAVERARKREVPVTIITTSVESSDIKQASYSFIPQAERLQKMGVVVYVHDNQDLLHAKILKRGTSVAVVSWNFNRRLDLESGLVFDDANYAGRIDAFISDLITKESKIFDVSKLSRQTMCYVRLFQALSRLPLLGNVL